jgi:DNA modification methylase
MNKIIVGNCNERIGELENESIDLVLFSPPYDQMRDYNGYSFDLPSLGDELFKKVKDGGVVCVVIQDGTKDFAKSVTTARLIVDWVDRVGFRLFETVIYSRDGRPGAWWNSRFRVDHEYILIFFKGSRPRYFNKEHLKVPAKHAGEIFHGTQRHTDGSLSKIKPTVQAEKKCRGTIWHYEPSKSEGNKIKLLHPATFPDKLAEDLILTFTKEGDVVLDPMCGSGTTLVQAKKHCREYVGFEISEQYADIAARLLNTGRLTFQEIEHACCG